MIKMQMNQKFKHDGFTWIVTARFPNGYVATRSDVNGEPKHHTEILIRYIK